MAFLELKGVSKNFGGLVAVRDLDLTVAEGEIAGLIGPNGAGKTTVFNLITGYIPASKGKLYFRGEDITRLRPDQIAKKGLVRTFQTTTLFKEFPALMNVLIGRHIHLQTNFSQALFGGQRNILIEERNLEKSKEVLQLLDMMDWTTTPAKELPYGLQRRLGVAIALAAEPRLLLLDEPMTGMNHEEIQYMMELIRKIRASGITVLLVEHNMNAIMQLCEHVTVMNFGRKIAEGTCREIQTNRDVIEAYLGTDEEDA